MPKNIVRHLILICIIISLVFPGQFLLAQTQTQYTAQMPKTMEEAKSFGLKILGELPNAMKKVWKEEGWPIMKNTIVKATEWLRPIIEPWWQKFLGLLGKEVEKRRPELEKEVKKETKEIQKDLWERFKELLK